MGKLLLISGGNGSGKSRYAENLIAKTAGPRYYIATMEPRTGENHRRVQKHILQRTGLNFVTLELPTQIGTAPVTADSVVLLEDVSNLLGNTLFSAHSSIEDAWQNILALQMRCKLLVAVTISGLSSIGYRETHPAGQKEKRLSDTGISAYFCAAQYRKPLFVHFGCIDRLASFQCHNVLPVPVLLP